VLEVFRKRYPKIKPNIIVAVAGNSLASRIPAERRAEKYLVDVVSSGANMLHDALYKAQILEPIKPALILPEVLDQSKWHEGGGSSAAGGTLGIPTRAPHPNAAKVFVNWLLSREGQIALQKLGRRCAQFPPHRYSKRRRRSLQPPGRRQEIFRSGQTGV
jgi:ABC-type Fe3+ transport system substrate-binding protein